MIDLPSTDSLRSYLSNYTSIPHLAGTPNDKLQAEWTREKFMEFGIPDTKIETYYPLLNYPISQRLAIVSGPDDLRYEARLKEDPINDTVQDPNAIPMFHGYSKNGTAKGQLIYANYGRREDFQRLRDLGIQTEGKIALTRYGLVLRGLKIRAAEQFGCIGILMYSDPADEDGPLNKDTPLSYPEGPWRAPQSAQRGSVQYLSLLAGDPLTPGVPATIDADRILMEESNVLPTIPSLPLTLEDALPLLRATENCGVKGNKKWKGGVPEVGYFTGPTEGEVEMENFVSYNITPIWDVTARIEGSSEPHRSIILGNHRDSWVYGAVDPSSGSAILLEIARVLGKMLQSGWRPKRTIILASWDAEEYGLIGSTEWVEDHRSWLKKEGAVYINCDAAVSGPRFEAGASPSLNKLIYEVTKMVRDPATGKTVYEAWDAQTSYTGTPPVSTLGSGSDFTAFLDHLGIASIDLSFSGNYGVYHSGYDSFDWMVQFGDPTFEYHQTMVRVWGVIALRLADDIILPIDPLTYATEIQTYVEQLERYSRPHTYPTLHDASQELLDAATQFEDTLKQIKRKLDRFNYEEPVMSAKWMKRVEKMNARLTEFERGFLDPDGIRDREWFKHVIYAPGLWTGYSSQVFPAIIEAFDQEDMPLARDAESKAAVCIQNAQLALL
ncbi:hypothetical protein BDB01DRAFT_731867 [Pilobolus umbonatus]|nr:hypothetical protein BDB01DRAFT_731867 [Pilobolus umbonatus]